jgi:hypothetical protein
MSKRTRRFNKKRVALRGGKPLSQNQTEMVARLKAEKAHKGAVLSIEQQKQPTSSPDNRANTMKARINTYKREATNSAAKNRQSAVSRMGKASSRTTQINESLAPADAAEAAVKRTKGLEAEYSEDKFDTFKWQ